MNSYFYLEIALRIGEKGMQTEISIGITTINLAEELSNKLISKWKIFFSDRKSPLHFYNLSMADAERSQKFDT